MESRGHKIRTIHNPVSLLLGSKTLGPMCRSSWDLTSWQRGQKGAGLRLKPPLSRGGHSKFGAWMRAVWFSHVSLLWNLPVISILTAKQKAWPGYCRIGKLNGNHHKSSRTRRLGCSKTLLTTVGSLIAAIYDSTGVIWFDSVSASTLTHDRRRLPRYSWASRWTGSSRPDRMPMLAMLKGFGVWNTAHTFWFVIMIRIPKLIAELPVLGKKRDRNADVY